MNRNKNADKASNLRQRAEDLLRQKPEKIANLPPEKIQGLIQELQVYQIELALQNEELLRTQEQLEISRDEYIDLYDLAPVGYCTISDKGLILAANLTLGRLLGTERSLLINQRFSRFVARDSQDDFYLYVKQIFKTRTKQCCELKMVAHNGTPFNARLESDVVPGSKKAPDCFHTAVIDVTEEVIAKKALEESNLNLTAALSELKTAQQQMLQQESLAAVGQLAAGIAHDFNNILTSILGFAELLQIASDTPEAMKSDLTYITKGAQRAAHLVRQILDFSRKSTHQPQQLDLAHLLKETVTFLERTIPENIRVVLEFALGEYLLKADPSQLQQVLTNLAVNAQDVMPAGGKLTISLSRFTLKADAPRPNVAMQPGEWIKLSVTDTGTGIRPEILPHIFDPFFTTKEVGKGTGLGLAQVYGIVQQHNGHILAKSQVNQGATFTIYLPAVTDDEPIPHEKELKVIPYGQGELILLVEDDPAVLVTVKAMLDYLNYRVLTAINAEEALAKYKEHKNEIALVLSDLIMPEADGLELAQALQAQNADVKVVIMTGYSHHKESSQLSKQEGIVGWIQKPPTLPKLAQETHRALQ